MGNPFAFRAHLIYYLFTCTLQFSDRNLVWCPNEGRHVHPVYPGSYSLSIALQDALCSLQSLFGHQEGSKNTSNPVPCQSYHLWSSELPKPGSYVAPLKLSCLFFFLNRCGAAQETQSVTLSGGALFASSKLFQVRLGLAVKDIRDNLFALRPIHIGHKCSAARLLLVSQCEAHCRGHFSLGLLSHYLGQVPEIRNPHETLNTPESLNHLPSGLPAPGHTRSSALQGAWAAFGSGALQF